MPGLRGFTLVEMLIALAIFSLVSMTAGSLLYQAVEAQGRATGLGDRLITIERGIGRMVRDVTQYVPRTVRDELGDTLEALRVQPTELEFTRAGWSNPAEHARSELQRVRYSLREGVFMREYWNVLDRAPESMPISQTLIEEVNWVSFEPIVESEVRYGAPDPVQEEGTLKAPLGVRIRLSVAGYGELIRVIELPARRPNLDVANAGPSDLDAPQDESDSSALSETGKG